MYGSIDITVSFIRHGWLFSAGLHRFYDIYTQCTHITRNVSSIYRRSVQTKVRIIWLIWGGVLRGGEWFSNTAPKSIDTQ